MAYIDGERRRLLVTGGETMSRFPYTGYFLGH
jgi:hypothetical protein